MHRLPEITLIPKIIGISGPSGGGKSTVALELSKLLGKEDTLILSTDDLHKYCRDNAMWDIYTHFNPEANNIEMGNEHMESLKRGDHIWRSVYCHCNGQFKAPIKIQPNRFIINEGLHAYYTERCRNLTDLKVYIETNNDLLTHWKICRDVKERGQSKECVLKKIKDRQKDVHFIESQKRYSDFTVWLRPSNLIENVGDLELEVEVLKEIKYKDVVVSMQEMAEIIKSWK